MNHIAAPYATIIDALIMSIAHLRGISNAAMIAPARMAMPKIGDSH